MAMNAAKDPKGYYVTLGVSEDASTDDIKSAFRAKAKRLHPDHNPSPIAAKQFHRVHEAYETLCDPLKRAAYDRGWRTVSGGMGSGGMGSGGMGSGARAESKPHPKKEPPKQEPPKKDSPRPEPPQPDQRKETAADSFRPNPGEQAAVCQCGKVTAQPRYIVFDMVAGQLNKINRKGLAGVFCRTCADKAALRASLITWIAGWWAWPNGPKETIKALVNNIRGGRKPPERNARLLIKQARAFKARGDMQLARACAEQALAFTTNASVRREVDSLLLSLSSFPGRGIKDRWATPGFAPFIQLAPLIVIVGGLSMAATLSAPMSLTEYVRTTFNAVTAEEQPIEDAPLNADIRSGRIYGVNVDLLPLRTGPGETYRISSMLKRDTIVLVTEQDAGGRWVRVMMSDETAGFVEKNALTPDVNVDVLNTLGGFGPEKDEAP